MDFVDVYLKGVATIILLLHSIFVKRAGWLLSAAALPSRSSVICDCIKPSATARLPQWATTDRSADVTSLANL